VIIKKTEATHTPIMCQYSFVSIMSLVQFDKQVKSPLSWQ